MAKGPSKPQGGREAEARAARLKAALKSNVARRKAQARARTAPKDVPPPSQQG